MSGPGEPELQSPFRRVLAFGLALFGFSLLPGPGARALDPFRPVSQYVRTSWREELPQSTVNALLAARSGYLWIGTYEGLVRFNGTDFRVFNRENTPALKQNGIVSLFEDRSGALWIGTTYGGVLRLRNGVFENWTSEHGLPGDSVFSIFEDRQGTVWLGTHKGLARMQNGRILPSDLDARTESGVSIVRDFTETSDGSLWAGTDGSGLFRFRDGKWQNISTKDGLLHATVSGLMADQEGGLFVGTYGGLQHYKDGTFTNYGETEGLANTRIVRLLKDRDGNLWVATEGGGLHRFRNGVFTVLDSRKGLVNDVVRALAEDREGNLWAGTNGGLERLKDGAFLPFTRRDGLASEFVRTVFEDSRGTIWAGSDGGGLQKLMNGAFVEVPLPGGSPAKLIRTITEGPDGAIWVGTAGGGVLRLEGDRVTSFGIAEGLPNAYVRCLIAARNGDIWAGTNNGLARFRQGKWTIFRSPVASTNTVLTLLESRRGALFFGTTFGGLGRLENGEFSFISTAEGLPHPQVFSLYEDGNGALWIGTLAGLCRLSEGRLFVFGNRSGLPRDLVFSILEDDQAHLWLSSNQGIRRVPRFDLEEVVRGRKDPVPSETFGRDDGMPSRQCNGGSQPSAVRARDGRLWYATSAGVALVDPRRLTFASASPPAVIEALEVDGEEVAITPPVEIGPGVKRVSVRYAILSLRDPQSSGCRIKLTGFDDDWRPCEASRSTTYTALPPGRYELRIGARGRKGGWNDAAARLDFEIRPHFYQRGRFIALGGLVLAAAVSALVVLRVRRLRRRSEDLERQIERRTADLSDAKESLEFTNEKLQQANAQLSKMVLLDPLTGLANRRHFESSLDSEWRRALRAKEPLSLLMVDVDHFKLYNDSYGHPAGDECLRKVADAMRTTFRRAGDLVARIGGEEFAILLPATSRTSAEALAAQLLEAVDRLSLAHRSSPYELKVLTVSAGIATIQPTDEIRTRDLVAAADSALYAAKQGGRHRWAGREVAAGDDLPIV